MNPAFVRFSVKVLITSVALVIAGGIVFYFFLPEKYLPVLPWLVLFFMAVSITSHSYLLKQANKDSGKFIRASMVMSLLRLVLYSAFAIIYLALNNENAAVFVVCLAVVYIAFTFLEISNLSYMTRR